MDTTKPALSRVSSPRKNSPSLTTGVHFGFIADDSLGSACQAAGEAALRKDVQGAIRAVLMLAVDNGMDKA